jgi:Apea-like HEPN
MTDDTPLSIGHAEDAARPDDDVIYLRSLLEDPFVEWVLANSSTVLSAAQLEVARVLSSRLKQYSAENPNVPIGLTASSLAHYYEPSGTTFINYCRRYAGGSIEVSMGSSGDSLLSALLAFGAECYGELLLPTYLGRSGPDFHHYVKTDVGKRVVQAIYDEGIFPLGDQSNYNAPPGDIASDYIRSLVPGRFASGLIWCAWNLAKLDVGNPTLAQLAAKIPIALKQLQSCFSGQVTQVTAIASLTGVRLPDDTEISGIWGRLRSARPEDHPASLRQFVDKRTITTTEAGDSIEISDAGDVILETNVSIQVHVNDDGSGWRSEGVGDSDDLIDKVRLAFALAVTRPAKPIIYTMWATTLFPFGSLEPFPLTDPQFMAARTPTLLSADEVDAWQRWISIIMAADMSRLKVTMTRTLRAMTERRDPSDRLIDAVIAWESLFGAVNESTLRVSASLARLLHPPGEGREAARKTYQSVYQARSDIVHANNTKTTIAQIDEHGRTAIEASLKAMTLLLTTHNKLLSLKSSTRSTQVLLGDDSPSSATTPSSGEND